MLGYQPEKQAWLELVEFCVMRQVGGFQGRCSKLPDTCYSFWVKATLKILSTMVPEGEPPLDCDVDQEMELYFLLECFTKKGGFAKFPIAKDQPDILHTLYAIAALSLDAEERAKLEDKAFLKEMSG